jgi:hypothetical protein
MKKIDLVLSCWISGLENKGNTLMKSISTTEVDRGCYGRRKEVISLKSWRQEWFSGDK